MLKVTGRDGDVLHVQGPPNGRVAPPGPYILFINQRTARGLIPSVGKQVFVGQQGGPVPSLPKSPSS